MPKPSRSSKKKFRDRDAFKDNVEMNAEPPESGYHSDSSEEEITIIHENRKQKVRRVARETATRVKEEPGCRTIMFRYCLFLIVLSLGVGMIINLYSTYGEYVSDAIFPPRTSSAGRACANGTLTNDYMVSYYTFERVEETTGWIVLNATQPKENLLLAWGSGLLPIEWVSKNSFKVWAPTQDACVNFIVWSV